ncbi:hypothetical protein SAMN04488519_103153 [Algoriphagus ornithinivorans]|uniref:Uncharacterized protein n=1 Tax=Algoriphagus ornithinivorans TaxID=226506 RepID=A0A1I5DUB4_9BACT|nr:hypothetical protein SAMN04488519_103153 [Algoriphagus ornithinivorans]
MDYSPAKRQRGKEIIQDKANPVGMEEFRVLALFIDSQFLGKNIPISSKIIQIKRFLML